MINFKLYNKDSRTISKFIESDIVNFIDVRVNF